MENVGRCSLLLVFTKINHTDGKPPLLQQRTQHAYRAALLLVDLRTIEIWLKARRPAKFMSESLSSNSGLSNAVTPVQVEKSGKQKTIRHQLCRHCWWCPKTRGHRCRRWPCCRRHLCWRACPLCRYSTRHARKRIRTPTPPPPPPARSVASTCVVLRLASTATLKAGWRILLQAQCSPVMFDQYVVMSDGRSAGWGNRIYQQIKQKPSPSQCAG